MKKDTIAKRVVILLVILMLDHFTQASLNSIHLNQGIRRELRTRASTGFFTSTTTAITIFTAAIKPPSPGCLFRIMNA
uniref:Secreted protein n=1 Tax=Tanacetum cinerariifolium TaxID=118510 RepID=A0A699KQZ2_TANCI|nr:hypothetical protein [Tanacetum cinerariifolium]